MIAEGAGLLPEKVAPLLIDNRSALWLVATPECIRQVRLVRSEGVSQATSDPKRAFENLVARDVLMTEHRHDADRLGSATGDGRLGWPTSAPYDRVVVWCSVDAQPQPARPKQARCDFGRPYAHFATLL